jgi:hypothetical protein
MIGVNVMRNRRKPSRTQAPTSSFAPVVKRPLRSHLCNAAAFAVTLVVNTSLTAAARAKTLEIHHTSFSPAS